MINLNLPKLNKKEEILPKISIKKTNINLQKICNEQNYIKKDTIENYIKKDTIENYIKKDTIEKLKKNNLIQYKILENTHNKRMERLHRKKKNSKIKSMISEIENKPKIFLSHNWDSDKEGRNNHDRVIKLNEKLLASQKVRTWIDESSLHGDITNSITQGIDNSDIIIICITRDYINKCKKINNDNCKLELNYSYERKGTKNIIPLVMEENCLDTRTWEGPVGAYLNKSLYIRMDDLEYKNLDKLIDEIIRIYIENINQ